MRLIFCASPGRCGTKYLATMLDLVPGVVAKHEPAPHFVSVEGIDRNTPDVARRFWLDEKLPAIERYLAEAEASIYAETDHAIMRGFYKELPRPIDVIVLSRPHREVALSLWRRNSIPGRTKHGQRHRPQPDGANLLPLQDWESLSDYQLCYWVCLEIEARCEEMVDLVRSMDGRVHRTSLRQITEERGFRALLAALSLPEPDWEAYRQMRKKRINESAAAWLGRYPQGDLDKQEREAQKRIA